MRAYQIDIEKPGVRISLLTAGFFVAPTCPVKLKQGTPNGHLQRNGARHFDVMALRCVTEIGSAVAVSPLWMAELMVAI
jgi:hypothetical protein